MKRRDLWRAALGLGIPAYIAANPAYGERSVEVVIRGDVFDFDQADVERIVQVIRDHVAERPK